MNTDEHGSEKVSAEGVSVKLTNLTEIDVGIDRRQPRLAHSVFISVHLWF
jgi:hypothetical protein